MKHDVSIIKVSLRNNFLIAVSKFVAFFYTGSASMLAEGIHSLVDSGNQTLLLLGAAQSDRDADDDHPFGHGKRIYFWSFIVALLLFGIGGYVPIKEGIEKIHHPQPLSYIGVGVLGLFVAAVFEGQTWWKVYVEMGKPSMKKILTLLIKSKDADMLVVFVEDTGALIGLFIAFVGTMVSLVTGNPVYDAIASVAIGCQLWIFALFLAHQTCELLIGEAIAEAEIRYVRRILNGHPSVKKIGSIKTMQMGNNACIINVKADFHDGLHDYELDTIIGNLVERIETTLPESKGNIVIQPTAL